MKQEEILFCKLMHLALHPEKTSLFSAEDISSLPPNMDAVFLLAKNHSMQTAFYDSLYQLGITLPPSFSAVMRKSVISYSLGSYQMLAFTRKILEILSQEQVRYILLKGVSLLSVYPKLEFRGYSDVDILISDPKEFDQAKRRFLAEGFVVKEDLADHQLELFYAEGNRQYLLELHQKVISSQDDTGLNQKITEIFSGLTGIPDYFPDAALNYFVFPHTENTVYLLLHMLQHFLSSGFGIRLLCDWTAFIEKHHDQIDWPSYQALVHSLGLTGFSCAMAQLCIRYLGLPETDFPPADTEKISDASVESLMTDILRAGEFGKNDSSRMLMMTKGTHLQDYLLQFHRQMKNRFPNAHHCFLCWPVLWIITGICFLYNNHALRKTSAKKVLAMTKKRQSLLQELHLFEK